MPRKSLPVQAVAPITALQPPLPPSPIVQALRKDWRWAGISQFIWTFSDAFGLLDWDIEELEADFDGDEGRLIPTLIAKLLFALTYNRQINRENAFVNVRKQYIKRHPERNPLGNEEEPKEWATLGLGQKVQILWDLCEWQLDDPARFRGLLKSEDEAASWRVDPVGWDKTGNTYYLFDDNRLWVQRVPPPPPRPLKKTSQKAKRSAKQSRASTTSTPASTSTPVVKKAHRKRERTPLATPPPDEPEEVILSSSRRRNQVKFYGNPTPTALALKRGAATPAPASASANVNGGSSSRPTRSSARAAEVETPSKSSKPAPAAAIPLGTRLSRRLHHVEDEWQQIPEEWLSPTKEINGNGKRKGKPKGKRDIDEESELSDLTDEDEHEARLRASGIAKDEDVSMTDRKEVLAVTDEPNGTTSDHVQGSAGKTKEEPAEAVNEVFESPEEKSEARIESLLNGNGHVTAGNEHEEEHEAEANGDEDVDMQEAQAAVEPAQVVSGAGAEVGPVAEVEEDDIKAAVEEAAHLPEGFVEWEAICVTLYDWRTWPEQFANSRDPDEQALYDLLTEQVGPTIIDALVIKEQERLKQEAVMNRKRSSRIATRELEKEEQMRHEQAQREMEDRMERTRLEEVRRAKEEADLLAREKAREDRLKEREERLAAREEAIAKKAEDENRLKEKLERQREKRRRRREGEDVSDDSEPEELESLVRGSRTASARGTPAAGGSRDASSAAAASASERWELACEVCMKTGWNIDGDQDVVCCDDCNRWQHVECHDRLDESEGRPKRNWDKVDFKCKECRRKAARKRQRLEDPSNHSTLKSSPLASASHSHPQPQIQPQIQPQQNGHHQNTHSLQQPLTSVSQSNPAVYPLVPGSSPGPSTPFNASRPPAPPLRQGEYYPRVPVIHPSEQPAGFAVHYPPPSPNPSQHASMSVPSQQRLPLPIPLPLALSSGYGTMPEPITSANPPNGPIYIPANTNTTTNEARAPLPSTIDQYPQHAQIQQSLRTTPSHGGAVPVLSAQATTPSRAEQSYAAPPRPAEIQRLPIGQGYTQSSQVPRTNGVASSAPLQPQAQMQSETEHVQHHPPRAVKDLLIDGEQ